MSRSSYRAQLRSVCLRTGCAVVLGLTSSPFTQAAPAAGAAARPAPRHVIVGPVVVSPAPARYVALAVHVGGFGYLVVGDRDGRKNPIYSSNDSCCTNLVWATPGVLVFDDDYNVKVVNVARCRPQLKPHRCAARTIASFSNFVVSKDGKWVAGYADGGGHGPETIGVVSIDGSVCRTVPRQRTSSDTDPMFVGGGRLEYLRSDGRQDGNEWLYLGSDRRVTVRVAGLPQTTGC